MRSTCPHGVSWQRDAKSRLASGVMGALVELTPSHPTVDPAHVEAPAASRWRPVGLSVLWVVVATWLQLARAPGTRPYETFWAEDGGIFYAQALRDPLWQLLFTPHAGYLQVVCRLVSQPAAHLPLFRGPAYMAVAAALITALLSIVVFVSTRELVPPVWARGLLAALLPFLPQLGWEVIASVANLHWPLAYAGFWVLLAAPTARWWSVAAASALVALAALSDPLTVLLLPAALVGVLVSRRRNRALVAPMVLVVCLFLQHVVHTTRSVGQSFSEVDRTLLLPVYAVRVVLNAITGHRLLPAVYAPLGPAAAAFALLAVGVLLVVLWFRADRIGRLLGTVSVATSVLYLVVALGYRGTEGFLHRTPFGLGGSRYTVVPLLLLWAAATTMLARRRVNAEHAGEVSPAPQSHLWAAHTSDGATPPWAGRRVSAPALLIGFFAVQVLSDWSLPNVRSGIAPWHPPWRQLRRSASVRRERIPSSRRPWSPSTSGALTCRSSPVPTTW